MDQNEPWADPWDSFLREKLQYKLYGLAQECVLEKTELREVNVSMEDEDEPVRLRRKKFFFRVTLAGEKRFSVSISIPAWNQLSCSLESHSFSFHPCIQGLVSHSVSLLSSSHSARGTLKISSLSVV